MDITQLFAATSAMLLATVLMVGWLEWTRRSRDDRLRTSLREVDSSIQQALIAHRRVLDAVAEEPPTENYILDILDHRREAAEAAQEVLNRLEYLGLGVSARVLDLRIVDRLAGRTILSLWLYYLPYIRSSRAKANVTDMYMEVEQLAYTLQGRRQASPEEAEAFRARWPSAAPPDSPRRYRHG